MNDLEKFLELPDVDTIQEEVYINERIGTIKIQAMSQEELKEYRRKSKIKTPKGDEVSQERLELLIVANKTISPNFNNADFLKKANCATAIEFISKKLLSGEIAIIANEITKLSGFEKGFKEDVEEAKN